MANLLKAWLFLQLNVIIIGISMTQGLYKLVLRFVFRFNFEYQIETLFKPQHINIYKLLLT